MPHPYQSYYEITCQKEAWQEGVYVVSNAIKMIKSFFDRTQPSEIIFAGCTSPLYIGESVASYWQSRIGIPVRAVPSSELVQFPDAYLSKRSGTPVLFVISRSGKTSETLWAVEAFAKNYPDRIFTICCNPGSPLAGMTQPVLLLPKGFEQTLAQTSSFSAMLLASLMVGAVVGDDDRTFAELQNAPAICDRIIQQAEPLVEKIMNHKAYQNTFFFGAGPTIGIAHDAQLKMMEMSLSDAMFFTFLESRHGPRSLITEDTLLVGFCTRSGHGLEAKLLNEYTKLHGATTVAITPNQDWDAGTPTFTIPVGCDWPDAILGLAYSPIMQLMAYYRAIHKGVNPDTSRNLTQHIAIDSVAK